jgi:sporulation protein YlmC with PRC-barrel domain
MKRSLLASSVAACFCLGLAAPVDAADAPQTAAKHPASHREKTVSATTPAAKCLNDLRAFDTQMGKDGYWLGGAGFGYGYPMGGMGYGYDYPTGDHQRGIATGYRDARPGYEVRTLVASANILARHGQQQECEDVLATTHTIYKSYVVDMHDRGVPTVDIPGWRKQQIAAAAPVTGRKASFRSDELLGTGVRDPQDEPLGSVDDLVLSPKTGAIAYLVIARGGIFGIDKNYVPVPWADFKTTPNVNLLVLDTTKTAMDAAPKVNDDKFATPGQFDRESQTVDAYWKTHLAANGDN